MSARPAAGIHPAAWIAWIAGGAFVALTTTDPIYLLLLWTVAWFVDRTHHVEGPTARSFRIFLIAALIAVGLRTALVLLIPVGQRDVAFAFLEGLRLGTLLVLFGTFNAVTDPFGLVRLAPKHAHEPALAAALALSIAPRTIASVGKIREAQRLRGLEVHGLRTLPALAVPVLERGMEEAMTLAESMDSRGHGRGPRTRYRPQPWTLGSVIVAVTALLAGGAFVLASVADLASLHPSTMPLALTQPVPALLLAVALLAVPGIIPSRGSR